VLVFALVPSASKEWGITLLVLLQLCPTCEHFNDLLVLLGHYFIWHVRVLSDFKLMNFGESQLPSVGTADACNSPEEIPRDGGIYLTVR